MASRSPRSTSPRTDQFVLSVSNSSDFCEFLLDLREFYFRRQRILFRFLSISQSICLCLFVCPPVSDAVMTRFDKRLDGTKGKDSCAFTSQDDVRSHGTQ